ncbi:hypothetical protein Micbo1qcDRAFT_164737 [Microdochium bolleyi]|uniref:Uncharacterized protein n=1 Tax=Microdochium bolleyi TaxID=196109 RepID=A0A136IZI2_9PEZI|nr:hypothetical protein Micbo1qcDRAFT_164737 [Microdochium bolleyi]
MPPTSADPRMEIMPGVVRGNHHRQLRHNLPASQSAGSNDVDSRTKERPQWLNTDTGQDERLDRLLVRAMVVSRWPRNDSDHNFFIPRRALDSLLVSETVQRELERTFGRPCLELSQTICRGQTESAQVGSASIKLMAILTLINKLETISDFVAEGICDDSLPFGMVHEQGSSPFLECSGGHNGRSPISFTREWSIFDVRRFWLYQENVVCPSFQLVTQGSAPIPLAFWPRAVLPITDSYIVYRSVWGDLVKATIHPDHYSVTVGSFIHTKALSL